MVAEVELDNEDLIFSVKPPIVDPKPPLYSHSVEHGGIGSTMGGLAGLLSPPLLGAAGTGGICSIFGL